jgi:hypothetical protein
MHGNAMIYQQVTLSGDAEWPKVADAVIEAPQGDAAHQAQRRTWPTPKDSPGTWYTQRDYQSR